MRPTAGQAGMMGGLARKPTAVRTRFASMVLPDAGKELAAFMARRIKIDPGKLIKMVREGTVAPEILDKCGLSIPRQETAGGGDTDDMKNSATLSANRRVKIGKRGSIAIPRKLVAELGLNIGDRFRVRPSRAGLSLKKISG